MKYRMIYLCLCIVLLLSGCQLVPDEYISVSPYTGSYSQPNSEEAGTVSNYTELKNAILSYVLEGVEEVVLTSYAYTGNIDADFDIANNYITQNNASGAYLVESIEPEIARAGSYFRLNLTINYRHNPDALDDVQIVRGPAGVESAIKSALENYSENFLLRVSGFEDMDFEEMVNRCYEDNLTTVMEKPTVNATVYPDSGDLRIVELKFTYLHAASELQGMQSAVNTIMNSAYGYVNYGQSEMEKAMLLYSLLSERHAYTEASSKTPAYSLLYEGMADSRAFSAVYSAMCTEADLHCSIVRGTKNGEAYHWNILALDSGTWHVDTFADEQNGLREMQLLTDEQMYGYEWEREAYPICAGAPEPPAPANEAPTPVPEETSPAVPDEPENTPVDPPEPPAEEDNPPDNPQPPEENSGAGDISS